MPRSATGLPLPRLTARDATAEAVADSASEPVKFVPSGRETGHQTPAAATPLM